MTTITAGNASHVGITFQAQATDSTAGADATAIAGDAFGPSGTGVQGSFNNASGSANGAAVSGIVFSGAAAAVKGRALTAGSTGGVFQNTAGGKILSGQNNSGEVFSVDNAGNVGVPAAAITISVPNANHSGVGTALNHPASLDNSVNPATAITADHVIPFTNPIGIVVGGAGTSGNAIIAVIGQAQCVFDGATTAGDYVVVSSITDGGCHDFGSGIAIGYPNDQPVLGRILTTNGGAGTYSMILFGPEQHAPGTYNASGTRLSTGHTISQTRTLNAGSSTEVFGGQAVFSSASSYVCVARDVTTPANAVTITYGGANNITLNGTGSDVVSYTCTGN